MANFEFGNVVVAQHKLELVSGQRPYTVCLLSTVLRDYFTVKLIKFDEVRPPEHVIAEQLGSFKLVLVCTHVGA